MHIQLSAKRRVGPATMALPLTANDTTHMISATYYSEGHGLKDYHLLSLELMEQGRDESESEHEARLQKHMTPSD